MALNLIRLQALAKSTQASHASHVRAFHRFCTARGVTPAAFTNDAAGADLLSEFVLWRLASIKFQSLAPTWAALDWHFLAAYGVELECRRHPRFTTFLSGAKRLFSKDPRSPARPLRLPELAQLSRHLRAQRTAAALSLRAMVVVAFWALLRTNEAWSLRAFEVREHYGGLVADVFSSKAEVERRTTWCSMQSDVDVCPVAAFRALTPAAHPQQRFAGFQAQSSLERAFLQAASAAGLDMADLSFYSLRRGAATHLMATGVPLVLVQRQGRWANAKSVLAYFDSSEIEGCIATTLAALHADPDHEQRHPEAVARARGLMAGLARSDLRTAM